MSSKDDSALSNYFSTPTTPIQPFWLGYGDLWAVFSLACYLAEKQPITYISRYSQNYQRYKLDRKHQLLEMLALEDVPHNIEIVEHINSRFPPFSVMDHHRPYYPLPKYKWNPKNDTVVYQLQTPAGHHPTRFTPIQKIDVLKQKYPHFDYIELGKHYSLQQNLTLLRNARCFIGIDSGMSHLAHTVGIPVYLFNWDRLNEHHPNKSFTPFSSLEQVSL